MKRIGAILITVAFMASCSGGTTVVKNPYTDKENGQGQDEKLSSAYGFDYESLKESAHPRLLLTKSDFSEIQKIVVVEKKSDDILYRLCQCAIAMADKMVADNTKIEYVISGGRLQTQVRLVLQRLFSLSFAYKISGEKKYLDKINSDLDAALKFPDWHPSHYLDVAEMSLAMAVAYDWLYDDLSAARKNSMKSALMNFALKTSATGSYHESLGNWNQVCNAGVVAAALAVFEDDPKFCTSIIEESIGTNKRAMEHIYSPDGNDPEGYSYWDYGTSFEAVYLQSLQTAFGHCANLDKVQGFDKTGTYNLFLNGSVATFSFCDGGHTRKATMRTAMWWLAGQYGRPEDLSFEMYLLNAGRMINTTNRMFPSVPIFFYKHPVDVSSTPFPSEKLWCGQGCCPIAMVKIGWNNDGSDTFLGIKGGGAGTAHPHMDSGSFVFDMDGVRWSDDIDIGSYTIYENAFSGFSDHNQTSLRWDVMRTNNLFHSTLSFYNEDTFLGGSKLHVTDQVADINGEDVYFLNQVNTQNELGAVMDLTKAYGGQVEKITRTIKLVDEKDLYVIDEVTAQKYQAADFEWRMATVASCAVSSAGINLTNGSKKRTLTVETNDAEVSPELKTWTATRPSSWANRGWDTSIEPALSSYTMAGYKASVPAGRTVVFTTKLTK